MPYIDHSRLQSPSTALREARSGKLSGHLGMSTRTATLAMQIAGTRIGAAAPSAPPAPMTIDQRLHLANVQISALLAPFGPTIDAMPNPPYYPSFTADLKVRPIDAMLNLLSPIQNLMQDAINIANARSGVKERRIGLPGTPQVDVVMGLTVPPVITDPTDREALRRLMIVNNFMILGTQAPGFMARGIAEALVNEIARGGARAAAALETAKSLVQAAVSKGIPLGAWSMTPPTNAMLRALIVELKSRIPLAFPPNPAAVAADLRRRIIEWAKAHLPVPQETYTVQMPNRFAAPAPPYKAGDVIPAGWPGAGTHPEIRTRPKAMNDDDWFRLAQGAPGVPVAGWPGFGMMDGLGIVPAAAAAAAPPAAAGGVVAGGTAAEATGVAVAPPLSSIVIGGAITAATAASVAVATKATEKGIDKAEATTEKAIDTAANVDLTKVPGQKDQQKGTQTTQATTAATSAPAKSGGVMLPLAIAAGLAAAVGVALKKKKR